MLRDQVIKKMGAAALRLVVVAVVIASLSVEQASAAPLTMTIETLSAIGAGPPIVVTPAGQQLPDGSFNYDGQLTAPDWATSWHFNADPDPHFHTFGGHRYHFQGKGVFDIIDDGLVELTNASAAEVSYMVSFDVPGGSLSPAHLVSAGVGAAVEGGELSRHVNGHPLFSVLIDGAPHTRLFEADFTIDDTEFLIDEIAPKLDPTPISDRFTVQLAFSLSPGATAHLLPQFDATPVPEPGTALLLVLGLVTMFVARRR